MKNILVIFGGQSIEHDVSVITGVLTCNSLKEKYNPLPVLVDKNGEWWSGKNLRDIDFYKEINYKKLKRVALLPFGRKLYETKRKKVREIASISAVINCIHGERGEDGSLAGLLKMSGIPLVSPSILASSVCMDKRATKIFLKGLNIPTLPSEEITTIEEAEKAIKRIGFPVIVKPIHGGSSIGVNSASDYKGLTTAVYSALKFDRRVLIEPRLLNFTEINEACYLSKDGIVFSQLEAPLGSGEILDFDDKYSFGKRIFPLKVKKEIEAKITRYTKRIYSALDMTGVIRIDYFVKEDKVFVNEINTVPGSLAYYLFSEKTSDFSKMLEEMIEVAISRSSSEETLTREFSSGILSISGTKGCKCL